MGKIQKVIGRNVKEIRTQLGLTQQVLAEKADISIPFLAQIESGTRNPSLDVIEKLASALDRKAYQLLIEDTERSMDRRSTISNYSNDLRKELTKLIKQIEKKHLSGG
jgi:transcriptional regulator with XRE-family HTH domain